MYKWDSSNAIRVVSEGTAHFVGVLATAADGVEGEARVAGEEASVAALARVEREAVAFEPGTRDRLLSLQYY